MLLRVELVLAAVCMALAVLLPRPPRLCARVWHALGRFANRRGLAAGSVGLLAAVGAAAVAIGVAWPEPRVHDEFSYLLGADTFAHGRLTNPPHPLWEHFETFHVNQLPTYSSMYPPGQALFLAAGEVLDHPLVGVWLSFGLACAATCWMLQAWMPPRWALIGAAWAAIRFGFLGAWGDQIGYWSRSYWGGAVAMLGGALTLGGFARLCWSGSRTPRRDELDKANELGGASAAEPAELENEGAKDRRSRSPSGVWWNALALAVGVVILANSRPFEGAVLGLVVVLALAVSFIRQTGREFRPLLGAAVLPAAAVLLPAAVAMAYYNAHLTGDPFKLPYQAQGERYALVPLFVWQALGPEPVYRHAAIRDYHLRWAVPAYQRKHAPLGYLADVGSRVREFVWFYVGPLLWLPLLVVPWVLRGRRMRFASLALTAVFVALMATTWCQPHYLAPAAALVVVILVQCVRQFRLWRWKGRPTGRVYAAVLAPAYVCLLAGTLVLITLQDPDAFPLRRARILRKLEELPGRHLVVVRYGPDHWPLDEWVFNGADIDGSKVVWARDMGQSKNEELVRYFRDRDVWELDADSADPEPVRLAR